ncbi:MULTISPECIES: major capsid protein [Pseudomonas]|uniref:major capsid protein n=1 Tax=Pseudomonas nitroreducens TaxID=46680 RepID=UPI001E4B1AAE|nr:MULTISPECIES: major capsid protein [Pseudomonas]MCE4068537.1 major capsid protein [Pseudomonas nitritireducens]MCE4077726.1 major capsid protein [Pseudomonas nitroreducens]
MPQYQSKKEMIKAGIKSLPMRVGLAVGGLTIAASSFAADGDIDTSGPVGMLTKGLVAVGAVATAALAVVALVKTYRYVRGAM